MNTFSYNSSDALELLPKRVQNSNKGTYGRVLIIGGYPNMSGAAYFSAKAAYLTGAGLVEIASSEKNRAILQILVPEAIFSAYDNDDICFDTLKNSIYKATVIVIGMGLSTSKTAVKILGFVLENRKCPIVVDADALNIISENKEFLKLLSNNVSQAIITPHLAEMSRLTGIKISEIANNIHKVAQDFADRNNIICVLKGHNTAVALPLSDKIYINRTGNSGMSTGGSGDVLAGVIGGLIAQGAEPYTAATLGVYLHGLSGDLAADRLTEYSVTAQDLIEYLPNAIKHILNSVN